MARPTKRHLPEWKVNRSSIIFSFDPSNRHLFPEQYKKFKKQLRNSASAYIKREDVREVIFSADGYKCTLCGSTENLQVDHITSVYQVSIGMYSVKHLNSFSNLQTLCGKCNASKQP